MAEAVYLLCAVTSVMCAVLLLRGYRATQTRLLFWSSLCFTGLAINNFVLLVDLMVMPDIDFSIARNAIALAAMSILLYGLVREER
jgi:hypothetical protein